MKADFTKLPRVYIDRNLALNASVALEAAQTHYLRNVLRRKPGEFVRLFNARDGEWLAAITDYTKDSVTVTLKGKTREQLPKPPVLHLLFAPLQKDRLDFLIEKSVELGVTELHPVLTNRTEIRKINEERLRAQITEAAEQCERMDIPLLHPLTGLKEKTTKWTAPPALLWCCERGSHPLISTFKESTWAFLIGPVGGFDDAENDFLAAQASIKPVSLGETILRAETAALLALGYAKTCGL